MIHDYYLRLFLDPKNEDRIKPFKTWRNENQRRLRGKSEDEKYITWQQEEIVGRKKKEMILSKDENINDFYPKPEDLQNLPKKSALIKISFTLKKPYTSKDEGEFHIIDSRIFENPIVRDKFTGLPMVRPSTWKGHLNFAAERVEWKEKEKKEIIKRLFGSESGEDEALKGRLYFFPTFFEDDVEEYVITPLKRDTRTPTKRGPIPFEIMKPGREGEFYLLYASYPRDEDFKHEELEEDLKFLAEALSLMLYTYGFSAKKTSGFGVIENLKEDEVEIHPEDKDGIFSILCTKHTKKSEDGVYK
jgi:CRISPR-associated protein Cmr2